MLAVATQLTSTSNKPSKPRVVVAVCAWGQGSIRVRTQRPARALAAAVQAQAITRAATGLGRRRRGMAGTSGAGFTHEIALVEELIVERAH
jgi:hypothetical protein